MLLILSIMANILIRAMYSGFDGISYMWGYMIGGILMFWLFFISDKMQLNKRGETMFGKKFKVLKEFKPIYRNVGDNYLESFSVYVKNGKLEYCIIDDNFGQPSPANYSDTDYAKMLRNRSSKILESLVKLGYIEELKK